MDIRISIGKWGIGFSGFLIAFVACSTPPTASTESAQSTPSVSVSSAGSTLPSPSGDELPSPSRDEPRGNLPASSRYREALHAGRRLARGGHYDEAARQFRAALAAMDTSRARCELGWTLFLSSRFVDAKQELDRAVAGVRDSAVPPGRRNTIAACLYNRGRVAEAMDEPTEAAVFYRRSLALRSNGAVASRLAELGDPPPSTRECITLCEGPHASEEDLRAAMTAALVRHHATQRFVLGPPPSPPDWRSRAVPTQEPFLELRVVDVQHGHSRNFAERSLAIVAAQTRRGWSACVVLDASGAFDETVSTTADDVLQVRGVELVARPRHVVHDPEGTDDEMHCETCADDPSTCSPVTGRDCGHLENYSGETPEQSVLILRDGVLVIDSGPCMLDDPREPMP